MTKLSGGLLMYRMNDGALQVLLVHPGGPFFQNKDDGAWSIPKGEPGAGEDLLDAAQREFAEETASKRRRHLSNCRPSPRKAAKSFMPGPSPATAIRAGYRATSSPLNGRRARDACRSFRKLTVRIGLISRPQSGKSNPRRFHCLKNCGDY